MSKTESAQNRHVPVEFVVLAPRQRNVRCRVLGSDHEITLRSRDVWDMVPGEIVTVRVRNEWTHGSHDYLSGNVVDRRLDVSALGLVPLRLTDESLWHPEEHYWGEDDEPLEEWARPIVARGARPSFEMEQVLPGEDPEDWDNDPILEANDLHAAGDRPGARKILVNMLAVDLRCLDAHAHLGNVSFEHDPDKAIRHYEAGVRIGELSLPDDGVCVLPWGRTDNRPFLRCMHGFGLCLWRLGRLDEASAVFSRMLWLNPSDNQGIRFMVPDVNAGVPWEDSTT